MFLRVIFGKVNFDSSNSFSLYYFDGFGFSTILDITNGVAILYFLLVGGRKRGQIQANKTETREIQFLESLRDHSGQML